MSQWSRKTKPLSVDISAAARYEQPWATMAMDKWMVSQGSLLEGHVATDRPDMLTPYNSRYSADVPGLTAYGGMGLFIAFTQKLGLAKVLGQHLQWPKRASVYNPIQLAECTVDAIACGINRISNTDLLKGDPLLPAARGLTRFPDHATLHRFITDFDTPRVAQVHTSEHILFKAANQPVRVTRVTLDFDATDSVVYGAQEEAAFGHKNSRDGHREYAIETAILGGSKDIVNHHLRRGNLNSSPLFPGFLKETLGLLPRKMCVGLIRMDAGYFSVANMQALDATKIPYLMGCTTYTFLLDKAYAQDNWRRISPDEEVCEVRHAFKDRVERRILIARHPDPKKTKPKDNVQPVLLVVEASGRDLYKHFACVAGRLEHRGVNSLWQSYAGRSNMENAIKESKLGFGLESIPSKSFSANQAYVAFVVLTYNLMNWFKRHTFGDDPLGRRLAKAVRQWLLAVPAIVERHADHWQVRLAHNHPSLSLFQHIQAYLTKGMPLVT